MFGSSRAPVTFVDVLWSLFHLLKGMSVRMEHATASSASSNAVEIRLQELRSSAVTRGREWLQDAPAEISVMELRKMATVGMLAVDRTTSGLRLESCALDCWKSWHLQRRSGGAEKDYEESCMFLSHGAML